LATDQKPGLGPATRRKRDFCQFELKLVISASQVHKSSPSITAVGKELSAVEADGIGSSKRNSE
jgi:hypothetical protein